jgi:hypothetical protein
MNPFDRTPKPGRTAPVMPALQRWAFGLAGAALLVVAAVLPGCGGGGLGSGGTGSPLALGSGTVTGFGSVIVDGFAYDDSRAEVVVDDVIGSFRPTEVRLGQQVEVVFDAQGLPVTFRVGPQVVGPVGTVSPGGAHLTVLGREVRINTDPALGPVTVLEGYATLTGIAAGDWVEVHGFDAPGGDLQATRLERKLVPPLLVRASGRIEAVAPGGNGFRLAGGPTVVSAGQRLPVGFGFAVGQRVTVLAPVNAVSTVLGETVVAAGLVRLRPEPTEGERVSVAGRVAGLDASSFRLGGVVVEYAPAVVDPAGSLANDGYVRVEGTVSSAGRLVAREVKVRSATASGQDIELKGTVAGLAPNGLAFSVRGVPVTVPGSGVSLRNCGAGLTEGAYVEVKARLGIGVLVAREIECKAEPSGSVVTREGRAGSVDQGAQRFSVVTDAGATVLVEWNAFTYFRDLLPTAAGLDGRDVEVDGVVRSSDGVLIARRVRPR